jgi:hypothetical protein
VRQAFSAQGATLLLLLQPSPASEKLGPKLLTAVLSITLQGQPAAIPSPSLPVTVFPVGCRHLNPGRFIHSQLAGHYAIGDDPVAVARSGVALDDPVSVYPNFKKNCVIVDRGEPGEFISVPALIASPPGNPVIENPLRSMVTKLAVITRQSPAVVRLRSST